MWICSCVIDIAIEFPPEYHVISARLGRLGYLSPENLQMECMEIQPYHKLTTSNQLFFRESAVRIRECCIYFRASATLSAISDRCTSSARLHPCSSRDGRSLLRTAPMQISRPAPDPLTIRIFAFSRNNHMTLMCRKMHHIGILHHSLRYLAYIH